MRRLSAGVICLVSVALLLACGRTNARPAPVPTPAPSEAPTPNPPPARLVQTPLWPAPGTALADLRGHSLTEAYRPLRLNGRVVTPVRMRQGIIYVREESGAVYLDAVSSGRGGISPLPSPQLLYRLPLTVGQSWTIPVSYPGSGSAQITSRVLEIAELETAIGLRQVVVLEVRSTGETMGPATERWVPGLGLLSFQSSAKGGWDAVRTAEGEAKWSPSVGRLGPNLTAWIQDDNQKVAIIAEDGRQLHVAEHVTWRTSFWWSRNGERDLLVRNDHPSNYGLYLTFALRYDPGQRELVPVAWEWPSLAVSNLNGLVQVTSEGVWVYTEPQRYPARVSRFRWSEERLAFRAGEADISLIRAESAEAFARRIVSPPPLPEADFAAMFTDPKQGTEIWKSLVAKGWSTAGGGEIQPVAGSADRFLIRDKTGPTAISAEIQLRKGALDWEIASFKIVEP